VSRNFATAIKELKAGNHDKARVYFKEVLSYDKNHKDARLYIDKIDAAAENYARARKLLNVGNYYDALYLLDGAYEYNGKARADLAAVREKLAPEISKLEKQGISLYEQQRYGECITVFEQLLIINPGNNTCMLYLPRAKIRYEAMQRLR
jgi:tetratricopeptide (TPR) repeat protein